MNSDQPSREQIEPRLTALLLGELPADEAALLRYTIAQDPALQQLHDELQATLVLVREAAKHPANAPVEKAALLQLSAERRQRLLTHFKSGQAKTTAKPEPLFWLKRIKVPRLVEVVVVVAVIAVLAAMLLPSLASAKRKAQRISALSMVKQRALEAQMQAADNAIPPPMAPLAPAEKPTEEEKPDLEFKLANTPQRAGAVPGAPAPPPVAAPSGQIVLPQPEAATEIAAQAGTPAAAPRSGNNSGYFTSGLVAGTTLDSSATVAMMPLAPPVAAGATFSIGLRPPVAMPPPPASPMAAPSSTDLPADTVALNDSDGRQPVALRQANVTRDEKQWMVPGQATEPSVSDGGGGGGASAVSGNGPTLTLTESGANRSGAENKPTSRVTAMAESSAQAGESPTPAAAPVGQFPGGAASEVANQDVDKKNKAEFTDQFATKALQGRAASGNRYKTQESGKKKLPTLGDVPTVGRLFQGSPSTIQAAPMTGPAPATPTAPLATDIPSSGFEFRAEVRTAEVRGPLATDMPPSGFEGGRTVRNSVNLKPATKSGSDSVVLGGENTYAGATTMNAGTLRVPPQPALNGGDFAFNENGDSFKAGLAQKDAEGFRYSHISSGQEATQKLTTLKNDFATADTTVTSARSRVDELNREIDDRSGRITEGLQRRLSAPKASLDALNAKEEESKQLDQDAALRKPAPSAPAPQPEILTLSNAFSTFSLNVSDVSFKFAEASLQNGKLPDAASIRSEEFINAFDYRDPEAAEGQPMAFTSERARAPFAHNRELLRFAVKTAAAGRPAGRALNLVLLLDNSGSMERADRVAIIREALRVLAAQLQPQDTVSVVAFARTPRLWADGIRGDQARATLDQVGGITPEGGTNLEEAMRLAYQTAHRHYLAGGMNRVVLLTDGAANLGDVEPAALKRTVEAQRKQGIALDCFGIGWEDYNDNLLEQLASNGDGRYAFLNSPEDTSRDFAAKLAGALQIAAANVKVQVEFNPARVIAYRQIGYATHQLTKEQFRDNTVAAGQIAAQEAGNALYTIETNPNGDGPIATIHVRYKVPGTDDYRELSWDVAYTGGAPALEQSSPAMRLAATASAFSEWLAASPYAQEVTLDELLQDLSGVPEVYGADDRPKQLETMIREAKSLEGK